MKKKSIILFAVFALSFNLVNANNLSITYVSNPDASHIVFNISWDNSWYISGTNWDAVWVFVKIQDCSASPATWNHQTLSTNAGAYTVTGGTGLYVEPTASDGMGVFIRRNSNGFGTQSGQITLAFSSPVANYNTTANYHIFGVEMVWVPQGNFVVGDNSTAGTQSYASFGSGGTQNGNYAPYSITSEAQIALYAMRDDNATTTPTNLSANALVPALFPKGNAAFYCMKYEISQDQYAAFLNDLTLAQQSSRTASAPTAAAGTLALTTAGNQNRNSIVIQTPSAAGAPAFYNNDLNLDGTYGDGADIACNYLSWGDLTAYLDWAGLRPMTELEYEKACRGSNGAVNTEFAWGSTTISQAISTALNFAGTTSEVSTPGNVCPYNAGSSTSIGPLRVGFAATSGTVRTTAGASYWGIMDLSGNVWEQCFSAGYYNGTSYPTAGIIYFGSTGDGLIDGFGNANDATWPTTATAGSVIVRGGNWEYGSQNAQVSDRTYVMLNTENSGRIRRTGGRGVRKL